MRSNNSSDGDGYGLDVGENYFTDSNDLVLTVTNLMYYIYVPLCCVVGLTGNCMVWVLIRSNRILKKLPSNIYLLTMATSSSIFLMSLFIFWLELISQTVLYSHSTFACKLVTFVAHWCDFCSVWLIVLVGFERLILLYRAKRATTVAKAKLHVITLLIAAFVFNSWILVVAKSTRNPTTNASDCDIYPEYETAYTVFNVIETVCCIAVPSVVIIISNVFVVCKLHTHMKRIPPSPTVSFRTGDFESASAGTPSHTLKSMVVTKASVAGGRSEGRFSTVSSKGTAVGVCPSAAAAAKHKKRRRSGLRFTDLQLTRSLLVVTSVFICLNLPNYIFRMTSSLLGTNDQQQSPSQTNQLLSIAVHTLLYTHHAVLFYLYIFYSPQMKKRLAPTAAKLLECYCFKTVPDFGHDDYHT
uniref:G-protein coupled receptors family 1 profile domain-containing protein n=1 Tax=Plectus sambesii TaxID=2011161 RepID=A0A914WZT6_9BILA